MTVRPAGLTMDASSGMRTWRASLSNVMLLVAGYGAGQGALFLAQTWLVSIGKLSLLADFGLHFSFAILAIIFVDAGSLTTLARHAAQATEDEAGRSAMWRFFWETAAVRLAMALCVATAGLIWLFIATPGAYSTSFVLCALPGVLLWSLNGGGWLDGRKVSGVNGIANTLPYLSVAGALLLTSESVAPVAGAVQGLAFSGGYAAAVAVHHVALHRQGQGLRFIQPSRGGILRAFRDAVALIGTVLPGQLYFRAQLLICLAWLGSDATGILVYVKQIAAGVIQLIGFVRRVEFPNLVAKLTRHGGERLWTVFSIQKVGMVLSAACAAMLLAAAVLVLPALGPTFEHASSFLAQFSIIVLSTGLALGLAQGVLAMGQYSTLSWLMLFATLIGLGLSLALVPALGLGGFVLADLAEHVLIAAGCVLLMRETR